jgi:hypothetical protein
LIRRAIVALVLCFSAWSQGEARAQTKDDVARAEALFNAGRALVEGGRYADACAKFAESKRLAPGLGVTLYLADCYERIGRTASAWTEFRNAEGQARERNDRRSDVARARAQALEQRLCRLTISVAPSVPHNGLEVLRDGLPVAQEELGLAVPVDAGDHVVVASLQGGSTRRTLIAHVGARNPNAEVTIDSLEGTAESSGATSGDEPPEPAQESAASAEKPLATPKTAPGDARMIRRWAGLGLGALGVVGIGTGAVFGLVAKAKLDESNNGPCNAMDRCSPDGRAIRKDAEDAALVSTVTFVGGAVALAAGAVLYATTLRRFMGGAGLVIVPAPVAGGGQALVQGAF